MSDDNSDDDFSVHPLRDAVVGTSPRHASVYVRERFDRAISSAGAATTARYLACARAVANADDRDPAWLPWLVGDVLARTVRTSDSPFGDRDAQVRVVSHVVALAVHQRWSAMDDLDLTGDACFEQIATGVRTVESDDRQFFERVVRETATLLDEAYVGPAVLDWQDAFAPV